MTKEFKNRVLASRFLEWYLETTDDYVYLGEKVKESLLKEGTFNISARMLFDECGYIPQHICEDDDGDNEYDPSELCFIQD